MIVISSAELRSNMKKYLDFASNDTVVIQRGKKETFFLQKGEKYLAPDDDLASAITFNDLLIGVKEDLQEIFRKGR